MIQENKKTKREPKWLRSYWRPLMAFTYMAIVLFDFIIGPVFWSIVQIYGMGSVSVQWVPLTLAAGGVFHGAMGVILGVSAFTRGQEKIQSMRYGYNDYEEYGNNYQYDQGYSRNRYREDSYYSSENNYNDNFSPNDNNVN